MNQLHAWPGSSLQKINRNRVTIAVGLLLTFASLYCNHRKVPHEQEHPSPVHTPAEELKTFELSPGLKIELVAAEPMVQDPVVITFDEDGRLWVVEMRGFMPDIDGRGEKERVGRVSVLEDIDGDGLVDKSHIYIDSLVMPRALALVSHGALIAESGALWLTQDLDGDLTADTKTLIDSAYAGGPSPEHSGNGLLRNLDNWYYNARSRIRYRLKEGRWERDSTELRGQWGISHDDEGRLYYNYNWSQLHADLVPPNYFSRNKHNTPTTGIDHGLTTDRRIYPIRPNPAVNRGYIPGTLDKQGRLLEFTAACSPLFYRGKALPEEYYGNVFVCEPSGNLVKRDIVEERGFTLEAHDATPGKEFLASTDERFRPVYLTTGPDGALYVADMYRGLIQHSTYVTPYLRDQTIRRNLVQPINRGRIWRIVGATTGNIRSVKLSKATSQELIGMLSSADGWYRDMAQRLLVERGDRSIAEPLKELVLNGPTPAGSLCALWTLDGLGFARAEWLLPLLESKYPQLRTTALRLLEPLARKQKRVRTELARHLLKTWKEVPIEEAVQFALAANSLDEKSSLELLSGIAERYDTSALMRDAVLSSLQDQEFSMLELIWKSPSWQRHEPATDIFLEMLTTSIVRKKEAPELAKLLTMINVRDSFGWKENALLKGLSVQGRNWRLKPVRLLAAPTVLINAQMRKEHPQLQSLSAMFEWPGHAADTVEAQTQHVLGANEQKQFVQGRPLYLTTCAGCHGSDGEGLSRFAPPLIGSAWVLGDEKRLALVVLHGLEGAVDVNGKRYDVPEILPVMPAHSTLDDRSISCILTYIRNEWGHAASAVSTSTVSTTRNTSQGRVVPWTPAELDKHMNEVGKKGR